MTRRSRPSYRERVELARALAARLGLDSDLTTLVAPSGRPVLVLGGAAGRWSTARLPVVVPARTATPAALPRGLSVVCGVRDVENAPAIAIADALSDALGLTLVLVHVSGPGPTLRSVARVAGVEFDVRSEEDRGLRVLDEPARAAGVPPRRWGARRLMYGAPGPALAVAAAMEQAPLIVVGASGRSRGRPRLRSTTRHLRRASPCPIVVCSHDPAPAMRLREALASSGYRTLSGP